MSEVKTNKISSLASNNDITIDPDGTGDTIIASDNVGIGTAVPTSRLHIGKAADTVETGMQFTNADGNGYVGMEGSSGNRFLGSSTNNMFVGTTGADGLEFATNNNVRMKIDSSGNVGIGVTSMTNKLVLPNAAYFAMQDTGGAESLAIRANSSNAMEFLTGGGVRATITSTGNVGIGVAPSGGYKFVSSSSGTSGLWAGYFHGRDYAKSSRLDTTGYVDFFYTPTGYAGYIYVDTSTNTTTYASSSDYRLKTEVTYEWDATSRLKQLKPARFKWISAGDESVPVDGFLAHEVSYDSDGNPLVPEAIVGEKDGMRDEEYEVTPAVEATYDDEGNILTEAVPAVMGTRSVPEYQGIDQAKLVPLLVKSLQEALTEIDSLKARLDDAGL